jgi:hypothetical protein
MNAIVFAACMVTWLQVIPLRGAAQPLSEQLHFSAEEENVKRPIALPEEALALIAKDPYVMELLKDQRPEEAQLSTWLSASEVHLDGPKEKDIIVVAKGPLSGANVTTFWILRPSSRGFEVMLTVPAHDLVIQNMRSKGYRDIEALAATAVRVSTIYFRFDGNQYKPSARSSKIIP